MAQLLLPGGIFVASLQWEDPNETYGTDFFRAGFHIFQGKYKYAFDMPIIEHGSKAGGLFVGAQRPSEP